jgi:NADPH:quinone reductase-like Zn-dependent oxidoreductase
LDLGADHGIVSKAEDISKRVMEITGGRGADVMVENVGEAVWLSALKSMARGGVLVTCGATTGPAPSADLQRMFIRQFTVMGSTGGSHEELRQLLAVAKRGRIKPVIDSIVPMDEVHSALSRLEDGEQFGKIALTIGGD